VLGKSGRFDGDDVLDILLARPETAEHVTAKLWREFVAPDVDTAEVRRIAARFRDSQYDIRVALEAILTSDAFYASEHRGVLVKSPVELVVGTLRVFDLKPGEAMPFAIAAAGMGQNLFSPPNVKGWPGGEVWINTTTLLARANFVNLVVTDRTADGRGYTVNVDSLLAGTAIPNANKLVSHLLDVLGPISLSKKQKKPLKNYVLYDDSGAKQTFTLDATTKDKKVRGLIHMIMTLPEYHQN